MSTKWLVKQDNQEGRLRALSLLLGDAGLQDRLGREGQQTVLEGLTLTYQAERLSQVYRECLE